MEISYIDSTLARSCNDDATRERRYGAALALVLRRRLAEIAAVAHLGELRRMPAARLRGHPDGRLLLVSLGTAADLQMLPRDDPPPLLADGSLHELAVHALLITAVQLAPAA